MFHLIVDSLSVFSSLKSHDNEPLIHETVQVFAPKNASFSQLNIIRLRCCISLMKHECRKKNLQVFSCSLFHCYATKRKFQNFFFLILIFHAPLSSLLLPPFILKKHWDLMQLAYYAESHRKVASLNFNRIFLFSLALFSTFFSRRSRG